ncbi:MICOS complex subunit MIC13 homolog QIL1 isoform X2 [Cryptotermes secundus]|uniref:MICOS complex subunit MIC13 homolog QIL1 isoform X2 n=1 Tax=Cryptotermes secundus TaxID=105785 RepID=UPI001454DAD2|nr:MICOS complex subunit MIC13 homolog QIL1 isoform X2 [Cryptotermes secundus]
MVIMIMFGVKVGLVGGVVYYTIDEGVWKSSEHTTELYSKIYKNVAPYVKEVPVEVPELPKVEEISFLTKNYWNKGVIASFVFLSDLPNKTAELSKQGYEYVLRQLEQSKQKNTSTTKSQETSK